MGFENYRITRLVLWIIALATLGRLLIGGLLELGNDEVYYLTYAYLPDLSHFDHPPIGRMGHSIVYPEFQIE